MKEICTCDLCGNDYEASLWTPVSNCLPVYNDNHVHLKIRENGKIEIRSYDLCPKCAHDILRFIEDKIWTVCGERFTVCDFCEHNRPKKCSICKFKPKKKMHTIVYQCFRVITNRLRERCLAMEDWTKYEPKFRYMMLSRMKQDCNYYLGYGNRSTNHLWAGDERSQIENMKALWNSFPEEDKPEWVTWEELLDYEKQMINM